jgi:pseudaminic acid cytidylyltransferase
MGNLCIIPARGGSKRIPRKNIKPFCGKPIIAYSIEAALNSDLFDEVMVSTDDEEIANLAKQCGANVPFMRSAENANDFATTVDVLIEVIEQYQQASKAYSSVCCCYPTAPFITSEKLMEGYELLKNRKADSVFPIAEYSYPIQRSLKLDSNNQVSMIWPEFLNVRSQDLEKSFHDAGQWYWMNVESLLNQKKIFSDNNYGLPLNPLEVQDIDNESDWHIAELKYEFLQSIK